MHFDSTITLGNILSALGMMGAIWIAAWRTYVKMTVRLDKFEQTITAHSVTLLQHAAQMKAHADRSEKQDDLLMKILGDVRQLMGRMEAVAQMRGQT